jgi:putative CocE/NonD family hydrolase
MNFSKNKHLMKIVILVVLMVFPFFCTIGQNTALAKQDSAFVRENYSKQEVYITMRDGIKLFTSIYIPKSVSDKNTYPFLIQRTCFGSFPYGPNEYPNMIYYSRFMMREKFIFVKQDVRGRYMSEGKFTNLTPLITEKEHSNMVDESTDAYDTIEWLLKNISYNNGNVGLFGISYAGFYALSGALSGHPAIKAVSPQAPVSDFFFEDFHHNGAFVLAVGNALPAFGIPKVETTANYWFAKYFPTIKSNSSYDWFLSKTPLNKFGKMHTGNFFWEEIRQHPNYDDYWIKRSIIPHLKKVKNLPPILNVGGWFDAEDLTGVLDIYKTIEQSHSSGNTLVMGPFGHGDWSKEQGHHFQGDIYFGDSLSTYFQKNIELGFFKRYLKNQKDFEIRIPKALLFDTGKKTWTNFTEYPIKETQPMVYYLHSDSKLSAEIPDIDSLSYQSDPKNPVPYAEEVFKSIDFLPNYMTSDQRFVSNRNDVLSFQSQALENDITIIGEILVNLKFSTSGTDLDFFVKLIDVYPSDEPNNLFATSNVQMAGYQQMIRSEMMRTKFRNSFSHPIPLISGSKTTTKFKLQDVYHTFKKGHRIMVQVQSSAFPLYDLNPQRFLENIYEANEKDFQKSLVNIFSDSHISVNILKNN